MFQLLHQRFVRHLECFGNRPVGDVFLVDVDSSGNRRQLLDGVFDAQARNFYGPGQCNITQGKKYWFVPPLQAYW